MTRLRSLAAAAAVAIAAAVGGDAVFRPGTPAGPDASTRAWTETAWPFPVDQWGRGRAFGCKAADCGADIQLYLRAKIGFCDCVSGVADDDHLDRIGDLDLVGGDILASSPGRAIGVHSMKGRSRVYLLADGGRPPLSVLSLAFNDRCDVVVATAVLGAPEPAAREDAVLEFVRSDLVLRWAETTLGL